MVPTTFLILDEIPLTPNQKVDRQRLLSFKSARNNLEEAFVPPRTPAEETLGEIWRQVLGIEQVGVHNNFFELGGDSILSIQIVARATRAGLRLLPKDIFLHQTIAELAAAAGTSKVVTADQGIITGKTPLTPIQHSFFEQELPEPHHFNQAVLLEVQPGLDATAWRSLVEHLLSHHDALRLRFVRDDGGWEQSHAEQIAEVPFTCIDLAGSGEDEQRQAIESRSAELQASLNLRDGPLVRIAYFDLGEAKPHRLLIVVHHLAIDGISWRILLEDLQTARRQLSLGEAVKLPPKTTSFKNWSERLAEYASSDEIAHEEAYWTSDSRRSVAGLPVDHVDGANTEASASSIEIELGQEETLALVQRVPSVYRTQINDVLLTAMLQAFNRWTGDKRLLVDVEGHGREELADEIDLSRTVGWFTSLYPLLLEVGEAHTVPDTLKAVKEQLRGVPHQGIGYGLLRYLRGDVTASKLRELSQADVVFNYLGRLDQVLPESSLLRPASESPGPMRSARATRSHLLEVDGSIVGSRLRVRWTYSANLHRRATVERLANEFLNALRSIIAHCESDEGGGFTPSDFPLARLEQKELDRLVKQYRRIEDIYTLSPVQQGMLFHTLSTSEQGAYTEQVGVELQGELEVHTFEQAWQQVVDRHSSLRTSFVWQELTRPLQVVHPRLSIAVERHDWRTAPTIEQQKLLQEFLDKDREKGFDLSQPPLMRLALIRLSEDDYYFVWTHHHIILDGWSLPLVVKEVLQRYEALRAGEEQQMAVGRPYRDYIRWLQQQDQFQVESYWRQMLKGFTKPVLLGTNGESLGFARHLDYGDEISHLSTTTTEALHAFARKHQLTLNTLVHGAWALLLNLYSGQDDVVFGMTVSGRPAEIDDIESMVGLFINTLPVRVEVAHHAPILSWLKQLQFRHAEMRQFEYCALVQEWSEVPLGQPLFETLLVYENYPVDSSLLEQGSLVIRALRALVRTKYPITLVVAPGSDLSFYIAYDHRRFERETIKGMLALLGDLLETIIAEPLQLVSTVLDANASSPHAQTRWPASTAAEKRSAGSHRTFVAPQTPLEEILAGIWAQILGVNEVSVEDSFFELGGHSLLATQVVSRLREAFQIELQLQHVFESPTVAGLAKHVAAAMRAKPDTPYPPLKRFSRDNDLPLSLAQEQLWALDQVIPGTALFNIPATVRLEGLLDEVALEHTLREIIRRHDVLRTTFSTSNGQPIQVVAREDSFNLSCTDLQTFPAAVRELEALRIAVEDARHPFDLTKGPLRRIKLLRLTEQEHWLLLSMHHIIADAWAAGVFVHELTVLYAAFSRGDSSPLPELSLQYVDFAHWQRECLRQGFFDSQLEYWKGQLDGRIEPLSLPTDRPRPETPNFRTSSQYLSLPADLTVGLKSFSNAEGVSLFMILVNAFQILLFRYSNQEDVRIGTLIANRNRIEIEDLFGLFVNTLVLRTNLSGDPTCREALLRVRKVALEGFNNQDLPFEHLLQVLERDQGLERTDLIDVLFVLQNAPVKSLELPGLTISQVKEVSELAEPAVTLTLFDLILMMGEGPEGLTGSLKYRTELFDETTIQQLLRNFQYVLESIVSQPEQRLSSLELKFD
jgi:non-ribosomal peptide synthase protein (TIGR01720 family)